MGGARVKSCPVIEKVLDERTIDKSADDEPEDKLFQGRLRPGDGPLRDHLRSGCDRNRGSSTGWTWSSTRPGICSSRGSASSCRCSAAQWGSSSCPRPLRSISIYGGSSSHRRDVLLVRPEPVQHLGICQGRPGHDPAAGLGRRGEDTIHDWNYLLSRFGLLTWSQAIGNLMYIIGIGVILSSVVWGFYHSTDRDEAACKLG